MSLLTTWYLFSSKINYIILLVSLIKQKRIEIDGINTQRLLWYIN